MKKLLSIIVLGLLLSGNSYAENIFRCEITHGLDNSKIEYIIKANDDYRLLVDINSETNKIDDSSEIRARNISTGEVIRFINNGKAEIFKMIVLQIVKWETRVILKLFILKTYRALVK